jgi:chromate transport protein ChrA
VVITTGFIGYLVAAAAGVARAAMTVFVPPCLVVTAGSLHYRRFAKKLAGEGVQGVTAATVGAIAGVVLILAGVR